MNPTFWPFHIFLCTFITICSTRISNGLLQPQMAARSHSEHKCEFKFALALHYCFVSAPARNWSMAVRTSSLTLGNVTLVSLGPSPSPFPLVLWVDDHMIVHTNSGKCCRQTLHFCQCLRYRYESNDSQSVLYTCRWSTWSKEWYLTLRTYFCCFKGCCHMISLFNHLPSMGYIYKFSFHQWS